MSKSIHRAEWKIALVKRYLSGEGSYAEIAEAHSIGETTLKDWVRKYQEQGEAGFWCGTGNRRYSKDFKIKCVKFVLCGKGTVDEIVAKYNISSRSVLRSWIMKYNANMEGSFCSISKTAVTTAATAACIFSYFPGLLDKGRFRFCTEPGLWFLEVWLFGGSHSRKRSATQHSGETAPFCQQMPYPGRINVNYPPDVK